MERVLLRCRSSLLVLSFVACATSACGVSQQLYNSRVNDLRRCESDAAAYSNVASRRMWELSRDKRDLQDQSEKVHLDLDRLEAEKTRLASNLSATKAELEDLRRAQQQAELRNRTYQALLDRLQGQGVLVAGRASAEVTRGRLVVKLGVDTLFDAGSAELTVVGQELLRQVAGALKEIPDRDFLVSGHTDNAIPLRGSRYTSNWELSTERAVEVVKFLQASGVDPRQLGAAGYSEFHPISDGQKADNRRIEIVVLPNPEELPSIGEPRSQGAAIKAPPGPKVAGPHR